MRTRKLARGEPEPFIRSIRKREMAGESVERYPFSIPAVRAWNTLDLHPGCTFLIGENGSGKSTLLEAIAVNSGFNPEGGTTNFRFSTRTSHSALHEAMVLVRGSRRPRTGYFLRAESFFNVATEIERLDQEPFGGPPVILSYGGRSLHEQSHGESFFALFMNRFGKNGLYLLDEPEAALSPMRQLVFLRRLHELSTAGGCQFVIATHSPMLMAYPYALIYSLTDAGPRVVDYEETEHFQVARAFLRHPDRMLRELLDD